MITLDFETFYDSGYSLSRITTEEYIRSPRFEVIGVAVQIDDGEPEWFSGDFTDTHLFLRKFDWENQAVASHNAMFDMAILCWRFGLYPKFMVDTMSMAKALYGVEQSCSLAKLAERFNLPAKGTQVAQALGVHRLDFGPVFLAEYGDYCKHDTWLCRQLYKLMRSSMPTPEMMAIDWTIQAYARPTLRIDADQAKLALAQHISIKNTALQTLGYTAQALRNDQLLADALMDLGVEAPMKESPSKRNPDGTPKMVYAFAKSDTEFMDLLEDPDPLVCGIVEARLSSKTSIVETRLQTFVEIAGRGALPYPLAYASAQPTLRWQAWRQQRVNLQNLPRAKPGQRSPLRDAICAPPGYKMMVIDLSQIELRVNAWLAGQESVLTTLRNGGDVYSQMASRIYQTMITKAMGKSTHTVERFVGKTATLGCGYQCGDEKFTHMLKVAARRDGFKLQDESAAFGKRCVNEYRADNRMIVAFWKDCGRALEVMAAGGATKLGHLDIFAGAIFMPDGMPLVYPNLHWYEDPNSGKKGYVYEKHMGRGRVRKWIYGGLLDENLSQRIARGIMRDGVLRIRQRFWVPGTVHDEAIILIRDSEPEDAALEWAIEQMTIPPIWAPDFPLAAEGSVGYRYGDCK